MVKTPERAAREANDEASRTATCSEVSLRSAEAIIAYRPIDVAPKVSALLVIGVEDDPVTPTDHAHRAVRGGAAAEEADHAARHHALRRLRAVRRRGDPRDGRVVHAPPDRTARSTCGRRRARTRSTAPSASRSRHRPDNRRRHRSAVRPRTSCKFCAVGDVTAFHKEPESGYEFVGPVLTEMDIVVAQNERHYSSRTRHLPDRRLHRADRSRARQGTACSATTTCSRFASNHGMDLGPDVMLETIKVLRDLGFT